MSFLSQDLLRKISVNPHKSHDQPSKREVGRKDFRDCKKKSPDKEEVRDKDFFSMVAKEGAGFSPCALSSSAVEASSSSSAIARSELSADIEAAFEKMASCMIVMSSSRETETTFFLEGSHFASSTLFGTQVTIREFSTAPKAFNIEIVSNPGAIALLDAGKNDLMAAFQNGNFNFSVHRFDTLVQRAEDRPIFHRKESSDQDPSGGKRQ